MRVLHLHSGNLQGGVETFLLTLARCRHLAPAMAMSVALCFEGDFANDLRASGITPFMLGEVRLRRPDRLRLVRRALRSVLKAQAFDVVVCHQSWPYAIFASVVRAVDIPLVLWVHMVQSGQHWLDRVALRVHPDLVVCNSRFTASTFPFAGVRVEHVYAPVQRANAKRSAAVRRAMQTPDSDIVITQVSRMEAWKGHAVCIDALSRLAGRPGWTCWIVGGAQRPEERKYAAALQASVDRLGLAQRVRFAGHRSDVADLLAASDIFCQPNLEPEPFGISLVEALSAGLPVVTSAIGGALEIVDEWCGVLVPPADSRALASALSNLVEDNVLRKRMGEEGRRRASSLCDPAVQMPRIAQLLESAPRSTCALPF